MRGISFSLLLALLATGTTGCKLLLPEISHRPVIRNPFPQLSRVAVAPFFNQSDEPTVDGRQFAMAYFAELQHTPGFEVVPVGVVEEAIIANRVNLSGPGEARRLAEILGVDAVVVGAVTDFSAYYPPRCGLKVEWYTANPGYHEIPAGYGLPWNTPEEEFIPDSLVYESQMALARAQMATQAPECESMSELLPPPPMPAEPMPLQQAPPEPKPMDSMSMRDPFEAGEVSLAQAIEALPDGGAGAPTTDSIGTIPPIKPIESSELYDAIPTTPPGWPDERCFVPPTPQPARPICEPYYGPVLSHARIYHGNDPELTEALKGYVYFRDDARRGGWESYLQRSEDFTRFCCHMHIAEMLSARGGSRKTQVVWRWPDSR